MSETPLLSSATRFVALLSNAIQRPSAETDIESCSGCAALSSFAACQTRRSLTRVLTCCPAAQGATDTAAARIAAILSRCRVRVVAAMAPLHEFARAAGSCSEPERPHLPLTAADGALFSARPILAIAVAGERPTPTSLPTGPHPQYFCTDAPAEALEGDASGCLAPIRGCRPTWTGSCSTGATGSRARSDAAAWVRPTSPPTRRSAGRSWSRCPTSRSSSSPGSANASPRRHAAFSTSTIRTSSRSTTPARSTASRSSCCSTSRAAA
jgi:hypothetical protein